MAPDVVMAASSGPEGRVLNPVVSKTISGKRVYSFETSFPGTQQIVYLDAAAMGAAIIEQTQTSPDAGIAARCSAPSPRYAVRESGTLVDAGKSLHPCLREYRDGVGLSLWSDNLTPLAEDTRSGYTDYRALSWNTDFDSPGKFRFDALDPVGNSRTELGLPVQPGSLVDVKFPGQPPTGLAMRFSASLGLNWGVASQVAQLVQAVSPRTRARDALSSIFGAGCFRDDIRWGATDREDRLRWLTDRLTCVYDSMPASLGGILNIRGGDFVGIFTEMKYAAPEIAAQIYPALRRWADPRADDTYVLSIDQR